MGTSKKGHDPSRAERKAKKRKLEDAIPDIPGDGDGDGEAFGANSSTNPRKEDRPSKRTKRAKTGASGDHNLSSGDNELDLGQTAQDKDDGWRTRSRATKNNEERSAHAIKESPNELGMMENIELFQKSKKERKAERKAREAARSAAGHEDGKQVSESPKSISEPGVNLAVTGPTPETKTPKRNNRNREKKRQAALEGGAEGKAHRFIAFIGNLPYSTTTDSLRGHFASVKPKSIRHSTEKSNPQKSKGFAFVEFEGYDHLKTCLKLFHHSLFDDGVSPPRKINVELTAGGGGNTKDRRSKIEYKNQKLSEERVRRIQEEEKAKTTKNEIPIDESSIHPSRRARVPAV